MASMTLHDAVNFDAQSPKNSRNISGQLIDSYDIRPPPDDAPMRQAVAERARCLSAYHTFRCHGWRHIFKLIRRRHDAPLRAGFSAYYNEYFRRRHYRPPLPSPPAGVHGTIDSCREARASH